MFRYCYTKMLTECEYLDAPFQKKMMNECEYLEVVSRPLQLKMTKTTTL